MLLVNMNHRRDRQTPALGFSHYSSEKAIVKKLGKPSTTSIHENCIQKMISYREWKASFRIQQGDVTGVWTSDDGALEFSKEYGEEDPLPKGS